MIRRVNHDMDNTQCRYLTIKCSHVIAMEREERLRRQSARRQFTNYIVMKVLDEVDGSTSDTFIPRALSREFPI